MPSASRRPFYSCLRRCVIFSYFLVYSATKCVFLIAAFSLRSLDFRRLSITQPSAELARLADDCSFCYGAVGGCVLTSLMCLLALLCWCVCESKYLCLISPPTLRLFFLSSTQRNRWGYEQIKRLLNEPQTSSKQLAWQVVHLIWQITN